MKLTILSADDKLAEIRRLYFATTKQTIGDDFARAIQLLKSMDSEDDRERATVYMDGIAQMRSDWAKASRPKGPAAGKTGKPGTSGKGAKSGGKAKSAGAKKAATSGKAAPSPGRPAKAKRPAVQVKKKAPRS